MTEKDDALLRELFAGMEVLKSQQREVNRRIGIIERKLDEEEDQEDLKRNEWWRWALQTIGQMLLVTAMVILGEKLGLTFQW